MVGYSSGQEPNLCVEAGSRLFRLGPGERLIDLLEQPLDPPSAPAGNADVGAGAAAAAAEAKWGCAAAWACHGRASARGLPLVALLTTQRVVVLNTDLVALSSHSRSNQQGGVTSVH